MIRVLYICVLALLPLRAVADPVVVFAAASLKGALDDILTEYTSADVVVSYGGSGAMAQQIAQGAPADLYLSASVEWVDWLENTGIAGPRVDLLSNSLVLIVNKEILRQTEGGANVLSQSAAIAMGQTRSVPVGIYARQSFETLGQWDSLRSRVIEFPSASAVVNAVELGEVPMGVVYFSDVLTSERAEIASFLAPETHDPVVYPMLMLTQNAAPLFDHLQSQMAADVFRARGFIVLEQP